MRFGSLGSEVQERTYTAMPEALTTCLAFAILFAVAIVLFAHLELRHPHHGDRIEQVSRLVLPVLLGVIAGFLPACIAYWLELEADPTWIGITLGLVASSYSYWVHPHRLLFSNWHSPAYGLALAYYQNHLRRLAHNAIAGFTIERKQSQESEGTSEQWSAPGRVELVVTIAIPELAAHARMGEIGRLLDNGQLHEYAIWGPEASGTRPDAVYSCSPLRPLDTSTQINLISIPTILHVVHTFALTRLNLDQAQHQEPTTLQRSIEDRQFTLFKRHLEALVFRHSRDGFTIEFATWSNLGLEL